MRAKERIHVYWQARRADRRGWIDAGAVFEVLHEVEGSGCDQWRAVPGGGFACMDDAEPAKTAEPGVAAARPGEALPFYYAARGGDGAFSYAFVDRFTSEDGTEVLVRPSGRHKSVERYVPHAESTFSGRDILADPLPTGRLVGWAVEEDTPVFDDPRDGIAPVDRLDRHTMLELEEEPVDEQGHWYRIPNGLGPGKDAYVDERKGVRHWSPSPVIDDVEPDELWIDLDLEQQVIALRRGDDLEYVTLVSSGLDERPTPTGLFRIRDKRAWSSMGNNPSSSDKYFIQHVPWTMYFRDYYALHGAYWHNVFGQQRSHGCVNLAPEDAKVIYEAVAPEHEAGFMRTLASDKAPGSLFRIRKANNPVPDRTDESY